jgi:hypothetical protein
VISRAGKFGFGLLAYLLAPESRYNSRTDNKANKQRRNGGGGGTKPHILKNAESGRRKCFFKVLGKKIKHKYDAVITKADIEKMATTGVCGELFVAELRPSVCKRQHNAKTRSKITTKSRFAKKDNALGDEILFVCAAKRDFEKKISRKRRPQRKIYENAENYLIIAK